MHFVEGLQVLGCLDNHTTFTTQNYRCIVAASTIQAHWRGHCVRKLSLLSADVQQVAHEQHITEIFDSVEPKISVQVYSAHELEAGQILTLWARTLKSRLRFVRLRKAAVVIQKCYRGHKVQKHYVHLMRCVCLIQVIRPSPSSQSLQFGLI